MVTLNFRSKYGVVQIVPLNEDNNEVVQVSLRYFERVTCFGPCRGYFLRCKRYRIDNANECCLNSIIKEKPAPYQQHFIIFSFPLIYFDLSLLVGPCLGMVTL